MNEILKILTLLFVTKERKCIKIKIKNGETNYV